MAPRRPPSEFAGFGRSLRHLVPRIDAGRWGGAALTRDARGHPDDVRGAVVCIQWLGLLIEIGAGRVRRP